MENRYSIKDLERLSGIKAHTLRIWEQRYGILRPQRTNSNIRFYSDSDLRRVLNISVLNNNGMRISRIANMSDELMYTEVLQITEQDKSVDNQISALNISMVELDEERFEKTMSGNILRHGFEKTMINLVFPFLERVGIMWMTGAISPAQEHFISNMIRQKLIVAIDGQMTNNIDPDCTYLLFCPEGEYHELGLLFMNYLVRIRHCRTLYLGTSVPLADLEIVYNIHKPKYLFTYITTKAAVESLEQYVNTIAEKFPHSEILVAGHLFKDEEFYWPDNVTYFSEVEQAIRFLDDVNLKVLPQP